MTVEFILKGGERCIVDIEDVPRLSEETWYLNKWGYAIHDNPKKMRSMSRFILNYDGPLEVDHINGDKLDNRKKNLRIVPHSVNILGGKKHKDGNNTYKGVDFKRNWGYIVCIDGERFSRYRYKTAEEARDARKDFIDYALKQKEKGEKIEKPSSKNRPQWAR